MVCRFAATGNSFVAGITPQDLNAVWHLDGYDKLKPYGICINACIVGFPQYILWAEANSTNSDPAVIASYFLETVEKQNGCRLLVRGDRGTENVFVAGMEEIFRTGSVDRLNGPCSFLYGRSTANQRIESWWSIYRKQNAEFWIGLFHRLQYEGVFSGDDFDRDLSRFCFMNLFQVCTTLKRFHLKLHVPVLFIILSCTANLRCNMIKSLQDKNQTSSRIQHRL